MVLPKKTAQQQWRCVGILSQSNRNNRKDTTTSAISDSGCSNSGCFRNRHRRRHSLALVSTISVVLLVIILQHRLSPIISLIDSSDGASLPPVSSFVRRKDPRGRTVVSRNNNNNTTDKHRLFDFLPFGILLEENNTTTITIEEASEGREHIIDILRDAGITVETPQEALQLPTFQQVSTLYGSKPILLGLDRCETFQNRVPPQHRFLGIAGNFNSGTTAFGMSLQANCRLTQHNPSSSSSSSEVALDLSNNKVSSVHGILSQVPWAKHKMAFHKENHTILSSVPKDHVLPVVLVRDPFFWMQSMCKQGYGVRWDHDSRKHCPNLVPNDYDKQRFGKRLAKTNATSIHVWMGANPIVGPSWDSLAHYWNAWYESYLDADWPRLLIRFEDTLFHPKEVMKEVCRCGGGEWMDPFQYVVDEAKWNHKQEQNNMVTAMIRYGRGTGRYHNMTEDDIAFARRVLNTTLLEVFHYYYRKRQ